jgi:glycosyltransferase involved in cell wall biosynthesis
MKGKKLVTIITPCYNSESFLLETAQSIIKQTEKSWKWFIIDDFSEDNSRKLIENLMQTDNRIQGIFMETNVGPAVCRNEGIERVDSKYMTFIDSDDLWDCKFLEKSIKFCHNSEGFAFSSYSRVDENTLKPIYRDFIVPLRVDYWDILKTNSISCLTAFIDVEKLGVKFMPEVKYRQDMGLWISYLKEINFAIGNPEVLAKYRIRKKSLSRNKMNLIKPQWFFYRNVANLNIIMSINIILIWAYRGYRKY